MDRTKQEKRQSLKVIISEVIMTLAVIITVTILALIVSGYWLNSDFEVERQGMLQISSVPTGASVNIDGESSWLQRTNTSKVLSKGKHTVTLTKDGYDSWSKDINIEEGLLYRLHYPRLFWQDRHPEKMLDTTGTTMAAISSNHESLILANNTTKWKYIDLAQDELNPKSLDVSKYFSGVSLAENSKTGLFTGQILKANWDYDATHILFKVQNGDDIEWVLLDVKNLDKSINLTKEFGNDFSSIKILDNNSSNLLAVQNGNLHKIDVSGRVVSAVLVKNILNFDHYENEIVFSATNSSKEGSDVPKYYIGYLQIGDDKVIKLTTTSRPNKVVISKFYDTKYITALDQDKVIVYQKDNFEEYHKYNLSFAPESIQVGHNGEFIIMRTGNKIATLDMEASKVRDWDTAGKKFAWIDNDMVYTVSDGHLIVYDYDGYNERTIAKNVSDHFPAGITKNKYLYYFSDDHLMREWIVEH